MTKTILIAGASTGFGRDTAETLAQAGHRVFAGMRDIAGRNRGHAETLRERKIDVVELDVTDDGSVDRAALLRQLVAAAANAPRDITARPGGVVRVSRHSGRTPYEVLVTPLAPGEPGYGFGLSAPTAAIFVRDPDTLSQRCRCRRLTGCSACIPSPPPKRG